jgi:acyl-CoA hydrolase
MSREISLQDVDFTGIIRDGDHIVWANGSGEPVRLIRKFLEQRHRFGHTNVFLGGISYTDVLKPEHADVVTFTGYGAMARLRGFCRAGALRVIPCHLSALCGYLESGIIGSDVVFLQPSAPDEHGRYSFSLENGYMQAAISRARVVIAEVNDQLPWTYFDGTLDPGRIDYIVPVSEPPIELESATFGPIEGKIARHICNYIEDGSTIEIGIGAIPDAVLADVGDRRDLGIHSGLIGDRVADLMERGVITNARKPIDTGLTVCGSLRGSQRLYKFAHKNPSIRMFTFMHTHRAEVLSQLDNFVAINSAIEVDLTGQINAEIASGVQVGGVGGQGDFLRGANLAARGHAIVAMPSTALEGKASRIVPRLTGVVTTARSDADIIVTEFGAAELRGQPLDERVRRMTAIAHPDFRELLEREGRDVQKRGI